MTEKSSATASIVGDCRGRAEKPRIGVVSGRYPVTEFQSYANHKAYCLKRGYTYISCSWPTGSANPYMNKIRYIKSYLTLFDYIFWIDDDAFFIDHERMLESILPTNTAFMSVCRSPEYKELKTRISSGQFMLRCDSVAAEFLDLVEKTNLAMVRSWWRPEHGYFTNGDQDAMVFHMETNPAFSGVDVYPSDVFNSRIEDLVSGRNVFVLHMTGTKKKKRASLEKAKEMLGRNDTLLSKEACDHLRISFANETLLVRVRRRLRNVLKRVWSNEPRCMFNVRVDAKDEDRLSR